MFDKQLCKWIHKKDITVGDIYNKLKPTIEPIFGVGVLTAIASALLAWLLDKSMIDTLKFVCYGECIVLGGMIGLALIIAISMAMITYTANIKVAHCPNVKDETKEE